MLEILSPYMPLIIMILTLIINVFLLILKSPWYGYLIANIILIIVLQALGLEPFDLIGKIIEAIINIIVGIFKALLKLLPTGCSSNDEGSYSLPWTPPIVDV